MRRVAADAERKLLSITRGNAASRISLQPPGFATSGILCISKCFDVLQDSADSVLQVVWARNVLRLFPALRDEMGVTSLLTGRGGNGVPFPRSEWLGYVIGRQAHGLFSGIVILTSHVSGVMTLNILSDDPLCARRYVQSIVYYC